MGTRRVRSPDSLAMPVLVEQTPRINGASKIPSKDR